MTTSMTTAAAKALALRNQCLGRRSNELITEIDPRIGRPSACSAVVVEYELSIWLSTKATPTPAPRPATRTIDRNSGRLGDDGRFGTSGVSIVLMSILSPFLSAFSAIWADSR